MSDFPPPPPPPPSGPGDFSASPPAHPEQGFVGHYHHGFQRIGKNAKVMLALLGLVAALQIVSIPMQMAVHSRAQDYKAAYQALPVPADDAPPAEREAWEQQLRPELDRLRDAQTAHGSVIGVELGATLAIAILTMIWMRKLILNHRLLGRPFSTWSPGWAIGGWFLPPGGIYAIPWLIFKELWRGSDPANVPNDPSWKQRPVSPIVHIWWVLFGFIPLVGTIAGSGAIGGFGNSSTASSNPTKWYDFAKVQTSAFPVLLVVAIIAVITPVVYGKLVRDLTKRQQVLTGEG